jgi:tetrahydromethanopterin S-methyltransferase subunit A
VTSVTLGTVLPVGAVRLAASVTEGCDTNNVNCRKVVVDTSLKRTITFDLLITTKGGKTLTSSTVTSVVSCGPNSITITEPTGFDILQNVDVNLPTTYFVMP